MKEETIRRICISVAVMIFLLGVWGILTRKDPIEKNIGDVYISDGVNKTAIRGNRMSVYRNGKKAEYDYPDIKDEADRIYKISTSPENSENMKISYSKTYYGDAEYSVYDSVFNEISSKQTSLNIPADAGKIYYISIYITWGTENENADMVYYFAVQT